MKKITAMNNRRKSILLFVVFSIYHTYAQTGKLTVISQPSNAYIWLNDEEIGHTPVYNRTIKPGYYTVRVVDPATNVEATRGIQIIADSLAVLNIDLGVSTGFLTVTSTPPGAEIALVTMLGKTPQNNIPVNADDYSVKIKHPKRLYSGVTEHITIEENKSKSISVNLPKNKSYIVKTTSRILLGITSIACYSWGFHAHGNDNDIGSAAGFTLGTVFLIGVEVLAF
jgi:hypothetical protein